ncbi:hypothetical protein [Deinococcus cellulosilyticus]|nr:hypothetical protein [Deinococcus cellulosilyticus]
MIVSILVVLLAVLAGQQVQKNLRPIPVRTREQEARERRNQFRR